MKLRRCGVLGLILAGTLAVPSAASVGDTTCTGFLPPGVYENVVVPEGGSCFMFGSIVTGNVKVLETGFLFTQPPGNEIRGNVQGEMDSSLFLQTDRIGGDVEVADGSFTSLLLSRATVGGSVQGKGRSFFVSDARIGGDVLADKVQSVVVTMFATGTVIGGNLEIKETRSSHRTVGVSVCGVTLPNGNLRVEKTRAGGIAIGPTTGIGCPPNVVRNGSLEVVENNVDRILGVGDNTVGKNLEVVKTTGAGPKTVRGNTVGDTLRCFENTQPFVGGPNTASKTEGQCF